VNESGYDRIEGIAEKLNIPFNIAWFHYFCNQRCVYCVYRYWYGFNNKKAHSASLTNFQIKKILSELKTMGGYNIDITGGEPLMMSNFIFLILTARKLGFKISMTTNGSLFTKYIADIIADIRFDFVRFSVNGTSASTDDKIVGSRGHFTMVLKWIEYLKNKGVYVTVNYTVIPENLEEIENAYKVFKSMGVPISFSYNFIPFIDNPNESKKFWLTLAQLKHLLEFIDSVKVADSSWEDFDNGIVGSNKKRCSIGKSKIVIGSDGEVYPCELLLISAGNAAIKSIKDIWINSHVMRKFRELEEEEFRYCENCKYKRTCDLFCVGCNYIYNRDITKPYPYTCRISRARNYFIARRNNNENR